MLTVRCGRPERRVSTNWRGGTVRFATKLILTGVLLATAGTLYCAYPLQVDAAQEGWLNDYEKAREVARKSGKPILLVFR